MKYTEKRNLKLNNKKSLNQVGDQEGKAKDK